MSTFVHFQAIQAQVASRPTAPIFKIPVPAYGELESEVQWVSITYQQFLLDIERLAKFWYRKLTGCGITARSVVGVWLKGTTYEDVVTIYALSRAGFVPEMFFLGLPNIDSILNLLSKYSGSALIHDSSKSPSLTDTSLPSLFCFVAVSCQDLSESDVCGFVLPPFPLAADDDFTFIYHTSGSVSGTPKVVPHTNAWLSTIQFKSGSAFAIGDYEGQDVYIWSDTISHHFQMCILQLAFHRGSCIVQPHSITFSSRELIHMIKRTGINRIIQFTPMIRQHLEYARQHSPELVELLSQMRQVTYAGMSLGHEITSWAQSMKIRLTNQYGCTECGQLLSSTPSSPYFELLPTVQAEFISIDSDLSCPSRSEYTKLYELRVLPTSPDLPIPNLRTPDGGWRSGDLFEKVAPGKYIYRGRDDDWVKSNWADRLDTKALEDAVYEYCSDLVSNCVVTGEGRPWPALFVELHPDILIKRGEHNENLNVERAIEAVKEKIIKRLAGFNNLRYLHERIQDVRMVHIVVPPRMLPRTAIKGNIRRRAVEKEFAQELMEMYNSLSFEEVFGEIF